MAFTEPGMHTFTYHATCNLPHKSAVNVNELQTTDVKYNGVYMYNIKIQVSPSQSLSYSTDSV